MTMWILSHAVPGGITDEVVGGTTDVQEVGFQWTADVLLLIAAVPMTIGVAIFVGILFYRAQKEDERLRKGDKP